ncbi:MAG TPA: serine/threonine-protein kinase [Kofleriaceae bacterium]|nr:serine/threonine-protein kinase [Kofleriaceae bacterium]
MPNDHYQLGELLGQGGMGQVHAARHTSGRAVAVKRVRNTLCNDRLIVDRLADEARLLRTVSHPNVVRALDDGTDANGMPFLVMDHAHGTPLNQLVARSEGMALERLVVIAQQLLAGLCAIHQAQIVHADLKSHNVLVDDVDIVTIIDFGLARTANRSSTPNGLIAGTPAYMAPELIAGAAPTVTADIYAAGTIIYEMLTGTTPFSGHISTILTRQLSEAVEPPSQRAPHRGISRAIDRVVLRALAPAPAERFQSVPELATALAAAFASHDDELELAAGSDLWLDEPTMERPRPRALAVQATEVLPPPIDAAIDAALARAQQWIDTHDPEFAVRELEAALVQLAPSIESEIPSSPEIWRIETVLAALYDSLGKQERGRRMALVAYRHALKTGCPLAERRAGVLVDRLVARSARLARGSSRHR